MNKRSLTTAVLCGALATVIYVATTGVLHGQTAVRSPNSTPPPPRLQQPELAKSMIAVLWTQNHNVIPVCWETSGFLREKTIVRNAVAATWGLRANLTFQGWGDCPTQGPEKHVRINIGLNGGDDAGADGQARTVGMATLSSAGENSPGVRMWFKPDGTADQGRVEYVGVHEFGHVLGFLHEQDSPANLVEGPTYCNQTGGVDPKLIPVTSYDKDSVMNYCNRDGNMKGNLTALDMAGVRWLYGQDPARATGDRTPVEAAAIWSRQIVLHVSDSEAMAWASIENGNPTDEVWLDRSWDGGRTWPDGIKLGDTTIPAGSRGWRTFMFSIDDPAPVNQHYGALRACGKAGNRAEIACTKWMTVCSRLCDGQDPARATGDRTPVEAAAIWSRQIMLHVSDSEAMAWASIENGNPTDEVWLDRSWDGGRTWPDGIKLGDTTIPAGSRGWRTFMYNIKDPVRLRSGVLRACGKAGNRAEIACTPWTAK